MNVKAKVLAMFKKFLFLNSYRVTINTSNHWQECLDRPIIDDSLTANQQKLKEHFASICGICIYLSICSNPYSESQ